MRKRASGIGSFMTPSIPSEVQYSFNSYIVYRGTPVRSCAYSPMNGAIITITQSGITNLGSRYCRCFASLIFHELLHEVGLDHNAANDIDDPTDPVWAPVQKCDLCSGGEFPWQNF